MLTILQGDVMEQLRGLPDESIQCCVTSPPYYGLRDYGCEGQIGLEETPDAYVAKLVAVFREVRRVLRDDGTLWLNLGDSYATGGMSNPSTKSTLCGGKDRGASGYSITRAVPDGLKPKDLIGIPWRVAFALQADGWYLRQDIIWHKPNPMPESVTDRCTKAHEYIFMLTKSAKYFYDRHAIKTPPKESSVKRWAQDIDAQAGSTRAVGKTNGPMKAVGGDKQRGHSRRHDGFNDRWDGMSKQQQAGGANRRDVWSIGTKGYKGAHFAVFPPELPRLCILAGTKPEDTVLDPFAGSGTTGQVALELGRRAVLIELNPTYVDLIRARCGTKEAA